MTLSEPGFLKHLGLDESERGMWLLTWSGRQEETGAELLLQALEYLLEGGERQTDTQTQSRMKEGAIPLSPTMIIYPSASHLPSLWMLPGDSSDVGGSAHHVPRHPGRQNFLSAA